MRQAGADVALMARELVDGLAVGDAVVSIGTSGTVFAIAEAPGTGAPEIAGFADVDGRFLPLACTLNAAQVLDLFAAQLGVDFVEFEALALSAPPGAEGLMLLPFFKGERTPNLPNAKASWHGVTLTNWTPANIARAAIEGILLSLANALELFRQTGRPVTRVKLIGGAAANEAVQQIAAGLFGGTVELPIAGEYVALGAARQAAVASSVNHTVMLPRWHKLASYATPFVTLCFCFATWWRRATSPANA